MLKQTFLALLGVGLIAFQPAQAAPPSVEDFAKPADIAAVNLSPDGSNLLIIRIGKGRRYIAEIRSTDSLSEGGFSFESDAAEFQDGEWINNDYILMTLRDGEGAAGNYFRSVFNAKGEHQYDLPADAQLIGRARDLPDQLFLSLDNNGDRTPDATRLDLKTGDMTTMTRGSNLRGDYKVDRSGEVRLSSIYDINDRAIKYQARRKGSKDWQTFGVFSLDQREFFLPVGFITDNPDEVAVVSNNGYDTAGLHIYDLSQSRITKTLFRSEEVDVGIDFGSSATLLDRYGDLRGFAYVTDRIRVQWTNAEDKKLAKKLEAALPGRLVTFTAKTKAGTRLITFRGPDDPRSYALQKADGSFMALGTAYPQFKNRLLGQTEFTHYVARDGKSIPLHLTRPATEGPWPLVVMPHGGPWARDIGGWDDWAQLLAAQGYLVAQPQFRGSTGFGMKHWVDGDEEWGLAMQDDLYDAVRYLQKTNKALPNKAAMFGWSYGGYAAFVTSLDDEGQKVFNCSVAGAGVTDLDRINAGLTGSLYTRLVQKPTIKGVNPIESLEGVKMPLLIVTGDQDNIVDPSHSRRAQKILKHKGIKHDYVEFEGLGHTSDTFTQETRREFYKTLTKFLNSECDLN